MTTKLVWRGAGDALEALERSLTEILYPAADAVTLSKDDPTRADSESDWVLEAYFETAPEAEDLAALLSPLGLPPGVAEALPDVDWVAHSLAGLGVVRAGRFVLYGSHDAERALAVPGIRLKIEANRAFGTGHHPTTAGCLAAMSRLEDRGFSRVLDVGTGSGVLALAARRLWPDASVLATDVDAPSISIAETNAAENGIDGIAFGIAMGVGDAARAMAPFGLILANILAEPLIEIAADIAAVLAPDGVVVLAGLLAPQAEGVCAAYSAAGLQVLDRVEDATWPTLLLGRARTQ